jgi:phage baseplate assembly protein W
MIAADVRLGTGWVFPPQPGPAGTIDWQSGPPHVRQSILLILDTEPGERVMRPDFGCGLRRHLMEPNTPSTRAGIAREIEAALRAWEPRIVVGTVDVTVTDDPATVLVSVTYTHLRDQRPDGFQLPLTLAAPTGGG